MQFKLASLAVAFLATGAIAQIDGDPCDVPGKLTSGPPPGGGSGCAIYFCKSDHTLDVTICGRDVPCNVDENGHPRCSA